MNSLKLSWTGNHKKVPSEKIPLLAERGVSHRRKNAEGGILFEKI